MPTLGYLINFLLVFVSFIYSFGSDTWSTSHGFVQCKQGYKNY